MNQIKKNITNVKQKAAAVRQKEANVEAEAKKQKEANAEAVRRQKEANVEAEAKKQKEAAKRQKEAAKRQKEANAEANAKTAAGRAVDIRKGALEKLLSTKNLESRKKNGFYLRITEAKTIQELEKIQVFINKSHITKSKINTGQTGRSKPRGQTGRSMLKDEQQNSKKSVRKSGRALE
jgi:hypothetical protein